LVVAGYDQSGGAGVLADVKTLEAHGVYAYAVCTAFTFQNERVIRRVEWFPEEDILEQIDLCFAVASFDWVKIGIVRSVEMMQRIIRHLRTHNPSIRIVLDPVIRASSGMDFWESGNRTGAQFRGAEAGQAPEDRGARTVRRSRWSDGGDFGEVAARCYLLTPNWEEIGWLYPGKDIAEQCRELTRSAGCNLYLKGGHNPVSPGRDFLWMDGEVQALDPGVEPMAVFPKHGSGCVLSSSLAGNLALGYTLPVAAALSKRYIEQFLTSNKTLLGWHHCIS